MDDVDIDGTALRSQLSAALGADVVDVAVLHDGLNLSLALGTAAEDDAYVLRRPNKFRDSDGFLDVRREYSVLDRLQHTSVPAPEPVFLGESDTILDDPFLVMTYADGTAVPLGTSLPERFQAPAARQQFGEIVVETLADLHTVDVGPFTDICEPRSPGDQVEEVIDRLETATAATGHEPPGCWAVADWLRENVPTESRTAVCHGDFRPGNILFVGDDRPAVSAVVDWGTTCLGDPLTELGYLLLRWRDDGDPTPPVEEIVARHPDTERDDLTGDSAPAVAPYSTSPGSPSRRELVDRYEKRTGTEFDHDRFYRALAAFDLAAIWADIYRTQLDSRSAEEWEPNIEYLVALAESITSGEFSL
jgi:aminoglycoside phosphotransferase (APT) family kinase protein